MIGETAAGTRLCPHCANTISEDAAECAYCKAEVSPEFAPSWLQRDEGSRRSVGPARSRGIPAIPPQLAWAAAAAVIVTLAFFAGAYLHGGDSAGLEALRKQLQAKDLMIQSQESQLVEARQKLTEISDQAAALKTKLEAGEKELAVAEQRLAAARRARAETGPSSARVASTRASTPAPQPASVRQAGTPAVYITTRPTAVYEDASSSSRVISQIDRGTRINVVGSSSGWLEVRSRRGNPPGFVRADDARPAGAPS